METPIRLFVGALALVGALVTVGVITEPSREEPVPSQRTTVLVPSIGDHDQLQRDAEMTQRMSTPGASGSMQSGTTRDDQLQRAQDRAYVQALEQHQAEIDRMLARP